MTKYGSTYFSRQRMCEKMLKTLNSIYAKNGVVFVWQITTKWKPTKQDVYKEYDVIVGKILKYNEYGEYDLFDKKQFKIIYHKTFHFIRDYFYYCSWWLDWTYKRTTLNFKDYKAQAYKTTFGIDNLEHIKNKK